MGDLHGSYDLFMKYLSSINFDKCNDFIIGVGDLVDRSKKSFNCVKLLDEDWFYSVRGNHEQSCIDGFYSKDKKIHKEHVLHGGGWFYALSRRNQQYIVDRFNKLPILVEVNYKNKTYGIAHGSLKYNNWQENVNAVLSNQDGIKNHIMRDRKLFKSKNTLHISGIEYVFFGHTITNDIKINGNCIFIDTGAYKTKKIGIVKLGE